MKRNYYIVKNGILRREKNTVYFESGEEKRILPVNNIYAIYAHGKITFSSGVVSYLAKNGVPIHFFNKYGWYEATLYPRESLLAGDVLIKQAMHYIDFDKRIYLAKEFIRGCGANLLKNLEYYGREIELSYEIKEISSFLAKLDEMGSIAEILSMEGNMWNVYYQSFNKILPSEFKFEKRSRQPPENMINCLISFGNSLLYSAILTEIYHTQLNPTISYLHEPSERRFSLCLDLAEVFKPLLADRVIFKLVNKKMIGKEKFRKEFNYCLLNDEGKRIFLQAWDGKLRTTITHRRLKRKVSYQRLIRLECYKLIKHLLGEKEYRAFRIWW
ncbi:MAG TPA: type I-B CRISPR-associated endonuclease Cas1 [Candidatus Atribacteria bacterium]|nr:type I-B CRISPR-associated endonuclease Cas1 [Candidatus Atribacteria bacterium]